MKLVTLGNLLQLCELNKSVNKHLEGTCEKTQNKITVKKLMSDV